MTDAGDRLAELARSSRPSAGITRVLAIDGRSGAGKSTLAGALALATGAPIIPMEQLYGGWDGLRDGIGRLVSEVLIPLEGGRAPDIPRYDWVAGRWLQASPLAPPELLIVEGVGAGALAAAPHLSALAWIELPETVRRERAMARDGSIHAGHWEMWSRQEEDYIASDRTPERADVIIAGERAA
jgi:uridine kinase